MKIALVVAVTLAVTLSPSMARAQAPTSRVAFENESIRVTVLTFPPGGATGRHVGLEPEVGIAVEGELVLESPAGRQVLTPETAYWMPGLTPHDVRNEGSAPAKLWDVFLKRCD
jgi:quercetin dioxygenase-like cupin family protein